MKCVSCDEEAKYYQPKAFCEEHWIRWWTSNDDNYFTIEEAESYYQDVKGWLKELKGEKNAENHSS